MKPPAQDEGAAVSECERTVRQQTGGLLSKLPLPQTTEGLAVHRAPSSRLVFTYLGCGVASFVVLALWALLTHEAIFNFYAHPELLAWVHLAVLGWINCMIFGVLFQFLPVALNVNLASERLAWWQLGFYAFGGIGMIASFWFGRVDWPLHSFATFLAVGFYLFNWNLFKTFRKVRRWSLTGLFLYSANLYLLVTVTLGLFLSVEMSYPMVGIAHMIILPVHAHFGLVGWFFCVIAGVGLKLLPMFLLTHDHPKWPGWAAFFLLHPGLLLWSAGVVFFRESPLPAIGYALMALSIGAWLLQVALIFRSRMRTGVEVCGAERIRKTRTMEFPMRFAAVAFVVMGLALAAGAAVVFGFGSSLPDGGNRLTLLYGVLVFLPFLSLLIQAFFYRIFPFLVWIHRFKDTAGHIRTPKVKDLVPAGRAVTQMIVFMAGCGLLCAAVVSEVRLLAATGLAVILVSALGFAWNLGTVWVRARAAEEAGRIA